MSRDVWHTKDENPDVNVGFACYRNLSHVENCTYLQNGGFQPTGSWAYIKDLLALETELERTRKALDIAVDALKSIDWCGQDYANAQGALEEIIALEQKDVK